MGSPGRRKAGSRLQPEGLEGSCWPPHSWRGTWRPKKGKRHSSPSRIWTEPEKKPGLPPPAQSLTWTTQLPAPPHPPLPGREGPRHNRVGPSSWVQGRLLGPGETSSCPAPPLGRLGAYREESATSMGKEKDDKSRIYSSFPGARQALFIFARLNCGRAGPASLRLPRHPTV